MRALLRYFAGVQPSSLVRFLTSACFSGMPTLCPMASTYAILTNDADLTTVKEMLAQMGVEELAALTAALIWVRAKAVYNFDPDLGAALLVQPFDDNLPAESLYVLPQYCVFIDYPVPIGDSTAAGMFAWLEFDVHNRTPELRLLYLMPDMSIVSMPIPW